MSQLQRRWNTQIPAKGHSKASGLSAALSICRPGNQQEVSRIFPTPIFLFEFIISQFLYFDNPPRKNTRRTRGGHSAL